MSSAAEMAERHAAVLAELSELGLALARDLQGRALAAADDAAASELAAAFHRVSRSVRQTLALEARLERERMRLAQEARAEAAREAEGRIQRRKAQVRLAVERLIWTEAEGPEAERLLDELDDRLDEIAFDDRFCDEAVEAQVARIRADLRLADSPPSPTASPSAAAVPPPPEPSAWRSSA